MAKILITARSIGQYGAARMMTHYASALVQAGHQVHVRYQEYATDGAVEDSDKDEQELRDLGIEVSRVRGIQWAIFPLMSREMKQFAGGCDLVFNTHVRDLPAASSIAKAAGVPFLAWLQNTPNFNGVLPVRRAKHLLYKSAVSHRANHVICVADGVKNHVIEHFGVPVSRVTAVPNGLDVETVPESDGTERNTISHEFGISDDEFLILNVARISRQKGQDILIKAISKLDPNLRFRVMIVGDCEPGNEHLRDEYQALASKLGVEDRFIWAGFQSDVHRFFYAGDLSVLPSRWEGLPITALESMATRTPLLMSQYGERFENFTDGVHGWYTPKEDSSQLAEHLDEIIRAPREKLRVIGSNGRKYLTDNLSLSEGKRRFVELVEQSLR